MLLLKLWLILPFLIFMSVVQAEEVKPIKYIKKSHSHEYRVQLDHSIFQILTNPLIVSSNRKKDILGKDARYEHIEKIFIKNGNLLVITWAGSIYGMQSSKLTYYIYEINNLSTLINRYEVHFEDVSDIKISEIPKGIQMISEESKINGKKFIYEFSNGKIFDFSTSMNSLLIKKEEERLCKGFYELYTTYEYEYDPYHKVESIYDLGTANHSWISHKVKSSPKLSDQLLNALKGKSLRERNYLKYNDFKNKFCD